MTTALYECRERDDDDDDDDKYDVREQQLPVRKTRWRHVRARATIANSNNKLYMRCGELAILRFTRHSQQRTTSYISTQYHSLALT